MNEMPNHISCAVLTPAGRGAVAVIGVFGPEARTYVEPLFQSISGKQLFGKFAHEIFYGHWISTGEDVVIVQINGERLEIHCHGGQSAPKAIMNSLVSAGIRQLPTNESARAIAGGRWTATIALALANSITETTAKILLHQSMHAESKLKQLLVWLDSDRPHAILELELMIDSAEFGRQLTTPRSVVLCGPPNVGKSSLVNAIVGFNRAIVHEVAGTTRDVVAQMTAINGWPIELKDTAGLRVAENEIEKIGIELSETEIRNADLVIAVFDASVSPTDTERQLLERTKATLLVLNKIDLLPDEHKATFERQYVSLKSIQTSSITGQGISELIQEIGSALTPAKIPDDVLIPISSLQLADVQRALAAARTGDFGAARETIESWLAN